MPVELDLAHLILHLVPELDGPVVQGAAVQGRRRIFDFFTATLDHPDLRLGELQVGGMNRNGREGLLLKAAAPDRHHSVKAELGETKVLVPQVVMNRL
jgi:hypothetical protein